VTPATPENIYNITVMTVTMHASPVTFKNGPQCTRRDFYTNSTRVNCIFVPIPAKFAEFVSVCSLFYLYLLTGLFAAPSQRHPFL